jgi:hypothetical protein
MIYPEPFAGQWQIAEKCEVFPHSYENSTFDPKEVPEFRGVCLADAHFGESACRSHLPRQARRQQSPI